ncbi:MAG: hypothetical protein HOG34_03120 [Bacteroidetes bacterium]|jgi:hypothetical protein|nr:hypothetical protein [Bacteroidota bacterium]MBT4409130.1 hypothetical protein [Bacteroidota bacterium]MBT7462958.1 hypothetical protein [Bacteroidota bacterium]
MLISCSANKNQKCLSLKLEPIDGRVYQEAGSTLVDSRSVLTDSEHFVWGGTVVEGDDGRYHMFYSIFNQGENEPRFSDAWLLSSKIAYAVSDYPDRDFKFKKIVLKGAREDGKPEAWDAQGVHNPHIRKFNGKYYLYYIGSRDPGEKPAGDPGANLNMRNRIQQVQKVAVIAVDRLEDLIEARFTRPEKALLEARTRVKPDDVIDPSPSGTIPLPDNLIVVNPTVEYRPSDGKYLMYFKGNLYDPGWRGAHGLALADNPEGPFSPLDDFMFDLRMEDGRIASAEDPYVWYHPETELFYAVFKDFQGKFTGVEPGLAMMISKDGLSWELHPEPFFSEKRIAFSDGSKLKVANLERPQFLINNAGIPLAFYAACSVENCGSKRDGSTFNVHFKVNVSYLDFP